MKEGPDIARIAALIGDPARANMLTALMDGTALTASELAGEAGIGLPTASGHLTKLLDGELVQMRKQGRHKYFQLGDGDVADALEALMGLAAKSKTRRTRPGPKDAKLRHARVCYNHLAGARGVQMFESLKAQGFVRAQGEDISLTDAGLNFAVEFGIDISGLRAGSAPLCRSCLDWSERRTHLAGSLGRAFLARMESLGWMHREEGSRAVLLTSEGQRQFDQRFRVT